MKHVEIVEGEQRIADVAMIKDTSTLHFKVTGWDSLNSRAGDTREPLIYVAGHNERYSFDNSIDSYAREVCYESYHQSEEGNVVSADIRVMHLDIDRFKNQPIWLHIQDAATGTDIIPDIDIINNVILKAKDAQGRLLWPDQESIDRTNEFWIDLSVLANLDISITVNGFEVIYADPNIDRP